MSRIVWDQIGQKVYETGTSQGVLYRTDEQGKYSTGVAWNGLTGLTESPSGAEENALWADDIKYASLMSAEEFGATLEAYTYPDEFEECDGSKEIRPGVVIGQQNRVPFGLSYKTILGNDTESDNYGYKLHMIYGCKVSPSEMAYKNKNDSPEAITFSWEITTTPVAVADSKPSASLVLDSTKIPEKAMKALEDILYGTAETEPRLPLPDEIAEIYDTATTEP